jgi:hypothetical protein
MPRLHALPAMAVASVLLVGTLGSAACAAKQAYERELVDRHERLTTNESTARWLHSYDWCAWVSSDALLAMPSDELEELGSEWFCLDLDDRWHAVYGRYDK